MAMISASDFRNGVTFEMDGKVMQVVEFQHVKPGKGRRLRPHQDEEHHYRRCDGDLLQPHRQV